MGYEVTYYYHPKKEDGNGYNMEEEKILTKKVGKAFDDTPLEKLAGAVMSQMARRDVLIFDVEIDELTRKNISFKESKDGRGILLKGKKYSFNATADLVCEDIVEVEEHQEHQEELDPEAVPEGVQPHELRDQRNLTDDLYSNPNRPVPVKRTPLSQKYNINPNKVLYWVYFEPEFYANQARSIGLKLTENKKYPVHHVVEHPTGSIEHQKLVITDDAGRQIEADQKFFTSAGVGLTGGFEADFQKNDGRQPTLSYSNDLKIDPGQANRGQGGGLVVQDQNNFPTDIDIRSGRGQQPPQNVPEGVPVDDGTIPQNVLQMPDIRSGK